MNNNNDGRDTDITEQPTAEYPTLGEHDLPPDEGTVEINAPARATASHEKESAEAAFWLSHLEAEVGRLHAKWESIDAEFKSREVRLARLNEEIGLRDATIAKLSEELQLETAALHAADDRLKSKDGEIAALIEERRARDERITALAAQLKAAAEADKNTTATIERLEAETSQLKDVVRQEQAVATGIAVRNEELLAEQHRLQGKLHDLEMYIDCRRDRWTELEAELAEHKAALSGLEQSLKERDAAIARHDEEKRELAARLTELEQLCAELTARRKERDEAFGELQASLAAHVEQAKVLATEHLSRKKEVEDATQKALDIQRNVEALERDIKRRDESIEALQKELEHSKTAHAELAAANGKLTTRAEELDKGLTERAEQARLLREDLRMSHDQLRLVQQQLADRTTQLAASQQALDQKTRHVERVSNDLAGARQDIARLNSDIEKVDARAAEAAKLRADAAAEVEQLKRELTAQREAMTHLETELRAKKATADLLERSVGRITNLGASLAALEQRMDSDAEAAGPRPILPIADLVATIAADRVQPTTADASSKPTELLPIDLLLDNAPSDDIVDVGVGERPELDAGRKLVLTVGGETVDYPIDKKLMTIGRAHGADIRISSHFVSRLHAKIKTNGIATVIEDAGSKNGVLVNLEPVKRRVLRHGDVVALGQDLSLRFVDATH